MIGHCPGGRSERELREDGGENEEDNGIKTAGHVVDVKDEKPSGRDSRSEKLKTSKASVVGKAYEREVPKLISTTLHTPSRLFLVLFGSRANQWPSGGCVLIRRDLKPPPIKSLGARTHTKTPAQRV